MFSTIHCKRKMLDKRFFCSKALAQNPVKVCAAFYNERFYRKNVEQKPKFRAPSTSDTLTAVTTNTRPIAFKRLGQSCVLVDVNQRKAIGIIFESLQDSKATWQGIENFTSLREGKSCLN